jgi:predicted anti-sigma-YlaC factor YlaD
VAKSIMFCDEVLDAIEPIAAGDLTPDGRIADHLATCPNCAAALDSARALERMLQQRQMLKAPPQFTTRTLGRVRRARWRSDQFLDAGFNVVVAAIVIAVLAGVWMIFNRTGLAAVSADVVNLFGTGLVTFAQRVGPSIPLYAGATALLATALGIWWWAERDATL